MHFDGKKISTTSRLLGLKYQRRRASPASPGAASSTLGGGGNLFCSRCLYFGSLYYQLCHIQLVTRLFELPVIGLKDV